MKNMGIQKSNFIPAGLRSGLLSLLLIGAVTNSLAQGTSTLTNSDGLNTSSFNTAHFWSGGLAPGPGTNFFTGAFTMRTPSAAGNYSFAGDSLTINTGGGMSIKGGSGYTITINNFTNSGAINQAINPNTTATLAGNMTVVGAATFNTSSGSGDVRIITNNMTMSGTGAVTNSSTSAFAGVVVYTADNTAFTGPLIVNNSQTMQAGALNNLGGNPAGFNAVQLLLNGGTFQPTASFAMNNANSGVTLGASGGTFNVGSNLTLTMVNPVAGSGTLTKSGAGTLILSGANTYGNTTVSAGILNVQNNAGLGTNGGVTSVSRNGGIQLQGGVNIPATVNFTFSNDGTGTGAGNIPYALLNVSGNNTINGMVTVTIGGGNAAIQSDSGALVLAGTLRIANGQSSRGFDLHGASTAANTISGAITNGTTGANSITKYDSGNWTLSGTNLYSGPTTVNGGTLFLSGNGSISYSPLISIASGATFDVAGLSSTFTLGAGQSISNSVGSVNGPVATTAGALIYPATVGAAGTLTFNGNLDMSAGGTATFDLDTTAAGANDVIAVGGNLTLSSSDFIHINALSGFLDTTDYVLFSVTTGMTMASTPVLVWDGSIPGNYLNYSLVKVGNNVVLHYSSSTAPSVTASANPSSATRNQAVMVTANVTKGSGNIASVTVDLTAIGGSATAGLALDGASSSDPNFVYTNTFTVTAGTTLGDKSLTVVATDDSLPTPLTGTYIITPYAITANNVTWDGGGADNKWSLNTNWSTDIGPGYIGDSITFSGSTQPTPDMDANYSVTSLAFDGAAGAFTLGSSTGSTLTSGGGMVNNSASEQTLNMPVVLTAAQTFNAASGNLTLNTNITLGANTLSVDGAANTTISGLISGTGGLTKNGSGLLTLPNANVFSGTMNLAAGTLAIGNDSALGTGQLNFGDGATIQSADSSAHVITNTLNFGSGAGGNNFFSGAGNLLFTRGASNGSSKTMTVNNPVTEFSGGLSGNMARTVAGTGLLIYSGTNTYSQGTTINPGATLQLGNGGTSGSLSTSGVIDVEGTLIFNRSDALVQGTHFSSAPIIGSGAVVQAGSGTTTLTALNTTGGTITVNNGELFITPVYQGGGGVSVANAAKFGIIASSASNSPTIGSLNLGSGGATTLDFSYGFAGNPTNATLVAGAVTISGTSTIRIGGSFAVGTFPVLKYSTLSGAFAGTVVGPRGVTATLSDDAVNHVIKVTISSVSSGIVWTGTNSVSPNLWDLNTTTNWLFGGLPTAYLETVPPGDAVTFNDLGSGTVLLSNTVSPAGVTINNPSVAYSFQGTGQINSLGGLTKVGPGAVTLNVPGTFSSSTVVSNGTISLGANQTFANLSGNSAVTTSAGTPTLTVNDGLNTTFSGNISVATLTKTGNSVLTLNGSASLTANVFVKAGGLTLDSGTINANGFCSIGQNGTDSGTLMLKGTASFNTANDFNVGDVGTSVGTLNIQDNASLTMNSFFIGSANSAGSTASGMVNQTGGTVTQLTTGAGTFCVGGRNETNSISGVGVYNLSGGTLTAASGFRVGSAGPGTFNQSGGLVNANGDVNIQRFAAAAGTYNLDGGILRAARVISSIGANATFNFNGGVLMPSGDSTTFVSTLSQVNVRNGGAIVDTTNFNVTISSVLQHSSIGGDDAIDGGLTKRGNGVLTLSGTGSSYTGPTLVTGGALNLLPGSVNNLSSLTVSNAALGLAKIYPFGSGSLSATDVKLTGNSALNLNYDLLSGAPDTAINVSGSLTVSGTTVINVTGYGFIAGQQFALVDYTGTPLANLSNFALGALPAGVTASLSNNTANTSIDLVVTSVGLSPASWIPLTTSDAVGTSSFNSAGHWIDFTAPSAGNGYFTRAFTLRSPADVNPYTFAGDVLSVDAGGQFLLKGTGGQMITVPNLILNSGLLVYGVSVSDNLTETLAGGISLNGGTTNIVAANGSAGAAETLNVTAPISGDGNLQINGISGDLGTIVLAANNTYTGTTTVAGGTLLVNGANGNSAITVNTNATLGGIGSIGGTVTVPVGGTLAPGIPARGALTAVIGTLTAGNTTVGGAVLMKIDRTAVTTSDELTAPSIVINPGATLTVNNIGSTNLVAGDIFTLFSTPVSGTFGTVNLPPLPDGSVMWTNKLAINGTIAVIAGTTINTNSPVLTNAVSGGNLTLSWPTDHTGWTLQVQTNSLGKGLGTNWVDVPGSTSINTVSIPITTTNGTVFYRLKL